MLDGPDADIVRRVLGVLLGLGLSLTVLGAIVLVPLWALYVRCNAVSPFGCLGIPSIPIFPVGILVWAAALGSSGSVSLALARGLRRTNWTDIAYGASLVVVLANAVLDVVVFALYLDVYGEFSTATDRGGSLALLSVVIIVAGLVLPMMWLRSWNRRVNAA